MERKIVFVEGEYYHIYNRGVDKRVIFLDTRDYNRFILLLHVLNTNKNLKIRELLLENSFNNLFKIKNEDPLVAIGVYCLMPNHFHLLLTSLVGGGISKFMLKVQTAYSMYFNKKYTRTGSLFEGPFKATHINNDNYLKYIYSYIHLNPAKLKDKNWKDVGPKNFLNLRDFVLGYKYSSMGEYIDKTYCITNPTHFPDYRSMFKTEKEYFHDMVDFWLDFKGSPQGYPGEK